MSKEYSNKEQTDKTRETFSPITVSRLQSRLPVGTVSRLQPKTYSGLTNQEPQAETTYTSPITELPEEVQTKMENSFGQDFSNVNIHKDSSSALDINAKAYAQGTDIHFAPGEYNPTSKEGQELIGHELTHVVQQRQGKVGAGEIHGKGLEINQDATLEKEADEAGKLASEGKRVNVINSVGLSIQKKPGDKNITDKGISAHAHGIFNPITGSYTIPDVSAYSDSTKAFDTLYSISMRFGVSMEDIKKTNHLKSDAVVAGQVLIISAGGTNKSEIKPASIKTEQKPTVQKVNPSPPKLIQEEKKKVASELISKHTSFYLLDESGLAKELVAKYIFNNPNIVSEVLNSVSGHNTDDVTEEILNLLPFTQWNKIDKKLLKEFYNALNSGYVSAVEGYMIKHIDGVLHPKVEKAKEQKTVIKPKSPEIKKQEFPKADSTLNNEVKKKNFVPNAHLFAIDKSKANADYLKAMYDNKNEGKWQKEKLDIPDGLTKEEERVKIAYAIEGQDTRKYGLYIISQGRLTDNIVDCAEFVSEVAWTQGYQSYPSGSCDDQLNWFKKEGEWGSVFSEIKVGDVIFWDRDKHTGTTNDHTAIVTEKLSDGSVKYVHASVNGGKKSINAPKFPTNKLGTAYANQTEYRLNFLAWGRFKNK